MAGKAKTAIMEIENATLQRSMVGTVLESISFKVNKGEFLSIIGASGSGKTTLLQAMAGLFPPASGKILFQGDEIKKPRVELGLVYQNYALFPWRSAIQNVEFGLELRNIRREKRRQMAAEALELMGLSQDDRDKYPVELSGGMQQRVAIARELVNKPAVIMLDEAFSALDVQTRHQLEKQMLHLQERLGITIILITHLVEQALSLSDRALVLSDGKIKKTITLSGRRPRDIDAPEFRKLLRDTEALIKPTSKLDAFLKDLDSLEG